MRKRSTHIAVVRRSTALTMAVLAASAGMLIGHYSSDPSASAKPLHSVNNPFAHPCKDEGQNGCYWNAKTMGNGAGSSYVVTKSGELFRFDPEYSEDAKHPFR